ncbi:MAG: nitrilase-related carbon-nitrogen hydrolase, partial [Myxococcota bacterium]
MFKVGYIQTSPVLGEVARNVALALEMASELDANLIVMPELFSTGYAFGNRELALSQAETADGPVIAQVVSLCRMQNKFVCGGFAERAPGGAYNSAFLAGPDGVVGIYRKTHLFHGERD